MRGNPSSLTTLSRACVDQASHAVILSRDPANPHSDDQTLAVIIMLEHKNPKIISVAECVARDKIQQMKAAGCDRIVCISELTNNLLIQEMQDPGIQCVLAELTSNIVGQQIYLVQVESLKTWKVSEILGYCRETCSGFIGMKRGETNFLNPAVDLTVEKGDQAILISKKPYTLKIFIRFGIYWFLLWQ